jgi:predicted  nucleic acid-binding Zn-ribbon protein
MDNLQGLEACDQAIHTLERQRAQIPESLAVVDAKRQAAREAVAAEEHALEEAERQRRDKEAELQDCEAQRDRFQSQTSMVKTNEEYTALLHEIEQVTERVGRVEEEILTAMEAAEDLGKRLRQSHDQLPHVEEECERQAKELHERLEEVEKQLERRSAERAERIGQLDPSVRSHYERVGSARQPPIARIQDLSCGICHRNIPIEVLNRLKAGEVHSCGNCQRLLIEAPG